MGKHETGYVRVALDSYPTISPWVVPALAEHIDLRGLTVHEPACGKGLMASALRLCGCARVYCSDIADHGGGQDEVLDFLSDREPSLANSDAIITNPPYGERGKLIAPWIEAGLRRLRPGGLLCLLLPVDCDSAACRKAWFADCPDFALKIVLTKRIVWFKRSDGERESPKENHAWFVWQRSVFKTRRPPAIAYAPKVDA